MLDFLKKNKKKISKEKLLQSKYTCKYVKQGTKKIGESLTVNAGRIIVRLEEQTLAIPIESVTNTTEDDIIVGDFDRGEAKKFGAEWNKTHNDKLQFDENGMLIQEDKNTEENNK